ncbi:hypothetical protein B0T13DRAFT_491813 [Neurospora crassa]|nr:hypothetical protein B0T13DRAFT_491813 [Neurospora crassa]
MSGLNLWLIVDANRMWLTMPIPLLRIFHLNCFAMKAAKMERSIDTQPRGLCKQEGISSPTRTLASWDLQHPTERSPAPASFPLSDLSNCASDRSCVQQTVPSAASRLL